MKKSIIWALSIITMIGCQKENNLNLEENSIIKFSSSDISTRTTQVTEDGAVYDAWESGDNIGISTLGFTSDYSNIKYYATTATTSATTSFNAFDDNESIIYPDSESGTVKFFAYYPYSDQYVDDQITINVANQKNDLGSVDFMTASKEYSYTPTENITTVELDFDHNLAKVVFNLYFKTQLGEVDNVSAVFKDYYTTATYDLNGDQIDGSLSDRADIESTATISEDKRSATITSIIHPGDYNNDITYPYLELTIDDQVFGIWLSSADNVFYANTIHTFNVSIGSEYIIYTDGSTISPWEGIDGADQTAAKEVWDGVTIATSFNGVNYGEATSYTITNGEELAYLAELTDNGDDMTDLTFTLLNNIDLGGHDWTPIDDFNGVFDGDGYKVKRLYINDPDYWNGSALFAFLDEDGEILNLSVEGTVIADGNCAGIVAKIDRGTVSNCSFDGTISASNYGDGYAGGITGTNDCGVIINCYNMGTISGTYYNGTYYNGTDCIGGIAGTCRGAWSSADELTGKIYACYNLGEVSSTAGSKVGGIAGKACEGAIIESCYNKGNVTGDRQIGGIVGYNVDSQVKNVYNMGEIEGYMYVGGILGWSANDNTNGNTSLFLDASCTYAYNVGNVIIDGGVASGAIGVNNRNANYCYAEELNPGEETLCGYYDSSSSSYIVVYSSSTAVETSNIESVANGSMTNGDLLEKLTESSDFISDDATNYNSGYPILKYINY